MQWLVDLIIEAIGVPPCYIDREEFVGEFASITADLRDGLEHVVDFSSIVPAGAKAVVIRFRATCDEAGVSVFVVKNGIDITPGKCAFAIVTAGFAHRQFLTIGVDADRKIKFKATENDGWSGGGISLRGWIL